MAAILADEPFADPDRIFDRNPDGVRCLAYSNRFGKDGVGEQPA